TPVTVPVGKYEVAWGRIVSGKGDATITAQIYTGKSEPVTVEEGKNADVKLGAPFVLDHDMRPKSGELEISSLRFRVLGCSNEQYGRMSGAPAIGTLMSSKSKDGKG